MIDRALMGRTFFYGKAAMPWSLMVSDSGYRLVCGVGGGQRAQGEPIQGEPIHADSAVQVDGPVPVWKQGHRAGSGCRYFKELVCTNIQGSFFHQIREAR